MTQKKIHCYFDTVSPFSYLAFTYIQERREILAAHGVEVEYTPVFLGGLNNLTGNKPPWTLPAKAAYGQYDGARAQAYFGRKYGVPAWFPMLSIMPQRALIYIKKTYSKERYEAAIQQAYETVWTLPTDAQLDISVPDNLVTALTKNGLFSEAEAREIIKSASLPEIKEALTKNTEFAAKELGAFGAPWFWVTNGEGKSEPFFGSDRFHFMWEFLQLPYQRVELLPPAGSKL